MADTMTITKTKTNAYTFPSSLSLEPNLSGTHSWDFELDYLIFERLFNRESIIHQKRVFFNIVQMAFDTTPPPLVLNMYVAIFLKDLKKCVNVCGDKIQQNYV